MIYYHLFYCPVPRFIDDFKKIDVGTQPFYRHFRDEAFMTPEGHCDAWGIVKPQAFQPNAFVPTLLDIFFF